MRLLVSLFAFAIACVATVASESSELRVTFATNPAIPDDQCNPLVRYELDADLSQLSIQATIETDGQTHIRNIVLKSAEGRLTATESVSGFSPDEASCSQVALKLIDIKCGDPETFMLSACPMPITVEGTEMFASFESLL